MNTLLVMTAGQTDVQLVVNDERHKLDGNTCGALHDAIKERSWSVVDAPGERSRDFIKTLPEGEVKLCTPKLDAVLVHLGDTGPTSALILETNRQDARDPRLAGEVMERRLRDRGVNEVIRVAFLAGTEQLEDSSNDLDAVVRRNVVARLSDAISKQVQQLTENDKVFVATTGGLAAANELINELVRLHAVSGPTVTALEVPDRERVQGEDRAVEEKFQPAAGFRARWHALSLIEKGNLLGAWGAVSHLEGISGQEWTQVVKWLAQFAASLPFDPVLPSDAGLAALNHPRMAVRAALRVELALRAGDIPRAVHGTVAFFEAALWDGLNEKATPHGTKKRLYQLNPAPDPALVRERDPTMLAGLSKSKQDEDRKKPFVFKETDTAGDWYWIDDNEVCAVRIAEHYLKCEPLKKLGQAVNGIRELRNDVAHNEPTPDLMKEARTRMQTAQLWSNNDTFLSQPLVEAMLKELGELDPEQLCSNLISTVRERLRAVD
jgi:hypothetical protein